MTATSAPAADLASVLDELAHDGFVAVCHRRSDGVFASEVLAAELAPAVVVKVAGSADVWFGVNPVAGPARRCNGRGTAADVVRLAAVYADLDVKPDGLADLDTAHLVVDDVSAMLGSSPVVVTMSGHGLQPLWAIDNEDPAAHLDSNQRRLEARVLLRRFGRLVAAVASRRHGQVDSVFDLARVLRVPGTVNRKAEPVQVAATLAGGRPLEVAEVVAALDAYDISEQPEDREQLGAIVRPRDKWAWAGRSCPYARRMIDAWASDTPAGRHPWLVAQAVRLAAAHRNGCLSNADYTVAVSTLANRFAQLLAAPPERRAQPGELRGALDWGGALVATMPEPRLQRELGNHAHSDTLTLAGAPPLPSINTVNAVDATSNGAQLDARHEGTRGHGTTHDTTHDAPQGAPGRDTTREGTGTRDVRPDATTTHQDAATHNDATRDATSDHVTTPPHVTAAAAATSATTSATTLARSEDGHAQHLIAGYGNLFRYCSDRGRWLVWDGFVWRWQPSGGGLVREYAKAVARGYPQSDQAALAYKRKALSASGTTGCLVQAATDPRVTVTLADLDAHPWDLNTPAGIVDLYTGELRPNDPTRLHTRSTACAPDPDADQERWETFLADTFGGDADLTAYMQRLVGYSAIGLVGPHILPFCYGTGGNGKGVFLEALVSVLGDYATTAPNQFLMATGFQQHETEIARLAGARMVLCSEVNEDDRIDEARVKQLTGGDTLTARFVRQDHFSFTPTHQLWLMGNHRPAVKSGGRSFWRRIRLLPFEHEVPEDQVVDDLQRILARDHGPALLNWIIAGATAYAAGGLRDPDRVKAATAAYAHDQDTTARFLEDACHRGGGDLVRIAAGHVHAAYSAWCHREGLEPLNPQAFGMALKRHGIQGTKGGKGHRFYLGLTLLDTTDQATEGPDEYGGREPVRLPPSTGTTSPRSDGFDLNGDTP